MRLAGEIPNRISKAKLCEKLAQRCPAERQPPANFQHYLETNLFGWGLWSRKGLAGASSSPNLLRLTGGLTGGLTEGLTEGLNEPTC